MAVFKCKMCGGTLEFDPGATIGVCDSCGTKQTLPRLDDDRRANLYDRANHFRRNNEFDKAAGIYEQILTEDTTDAEAYWSLVLCQYGIEYVEDPTTHKRVPTVNRAQFTSIFDDDNYKSALQYADNYQRSIYEEEANAINEIQKGILTISQKEDPFDVFICYKETDNNGRRTQDSVLATDLYHQLTQEGFKVFFSRITLEDKLGTAYEPYIFAALNSAKVMVVLGTKPEHFNAVWVKNEWSRYLALVKQSGGKKVLIPAYRDMDPYDLPEEFSHLQAQDMSKLGFMQDLIRGIKKIATADEPKTTVKETVLINSGNANVTPLLERAFLFLEDGKWQDADIYCEKVLDIDPKNAEAYLGKLMAELKVRTREQLADCAEPFDNRENYGKVIRFGDEQLESEIRGYIDHINERNENARLTGIYNDAVSAMKEANSEAEYKFAAEKFKSIPGFEDADSLAEQSLEKAEICRKDSVYASGKSHMKGFSAKEYEVAITIFQTISGWKDADEQINVCQEKIEEIKVNEEAHRLATKKRKRMTAIVFTPIFIACVAFVIVLLSVINSKLKMNKAMELLDSGEYESAYALLEEIGKADAIISNKYDRAVELINSNDYEPAYALLEEIGQDDVITSNKYDRAVALIDSGEYESAYALLEEIGKGDTIENNKYDRAMELLDAHDYDAAYSLLEETGNSDLITASKYDRAMELLDAHDYDAAYLLLKEIGNSETINESKYERANELIDSGDYENAYKLLNGLNYKDSVDRLDSIRPQYEKILISKAQVGSYIMLGSYEQDDNRKNGKEDIEWKVLAKDGGKLLIVSSSVLDWKPFDIGESSFKAETWETCSLREWLNKTLINLIFSTREQDLIKTTRVATDYGNVTTDKLFLLSIAEVNKYFNSDEARICKPTVYAQHKGASTNGCRWWLRSTGNIVAIDYDGEVNKWLDRDLAEAGVRPALWISADN